MSTRSSIHEALASPATRPAVSPPNPVVQQGASATADSAALAECPSPLASHPS